MPTTRPGRLMIGTLASVGLLFTSAPANASPSPPTLGVAGSASTAASTPQKVRLGLPQRIKERGTTVLLKKPTFTNAGQRVRVTVEVKSRQGRGVTSSDARVVRKHGRVALDLSGRTWVRATVSWHAKASAGYAPYSKTRVYKSWKKTYRAGYPATGANRVGVEWKDVLSGLLTAVASEFGGGAAGWAVGFLFSMTDDPKPDPIGEIKKQLEQMAAQLDSISSKLSDLERQSAFQACAQQTQVGTDAVATINTQAKQFRRYMNPDNPNKDRKDWVRWANDVLDTRNGSLQRLETLRLQLLSKGGTAGALQQCGEAFRLKWEGDQALGEAAYYENMWTYLNYFYQAQILGLDNVVEAYHLLAADAYKGDGPKPRPLPAPKDIKSICKATTTTKDGASPSQYCEYAALETKDLYYAMLNEAKTVGAAYAWNVDAQKAIAVQAKTSLLWVTDLNKYGSRSGCDGPVSSRRTACGPTVGKTEGLSVTKSLGYDGWETATSARWRGLLVPKSKASRTGEAMAKVGFPANMQRDIIIYTGESVDRNSSQMQWLAGDSRQEWFPLKNDDGALCLLDTDLGPSNDDRPSWAYCQDDQSFFYLANQFEDENRASCTTTYTYKASPLANGGSNASFYRSQFSGSHYHPCQGQGNYYVGPSVDIAPGWMLKGSGSGTAQYRWPVQDVSRRQCLSNLNWGADKSAMQPRNASGAWTMCGEDFKSWLKTQLPDPPK
jgi:hypothetical protein